MMMTRNFIITIILFIGIIWLQIHLSKKESKWPGLILPILNFLLATFMALTMTPAYYGFSTTVNGVVVEETRGAVAGAFGHMLSTFLFLNVGTVILLLIYLSCRGNVNRNKDLEKMAIKDLE